METSTPRLRSGAERKRPESSLWRNRGAFRPESGPLKIWVNPVARKPHSRGQSVNRYQLAVKTLHSNVAQRTAGVDVKHPLRIAAMNASVGRKAAEGLTAASGYFGLTREPVEFGEQRSRVHG
jgi:hypothetical protein